MLIGPQDVFGRLHVDASFPFELARHLDTHVEHHR